MLSFEYGTQNEQTALKIQTVFFFFFKKVPNMRKIIFYMVKKTVNLEMSKQEEQAQHLRAQVFQNLNIKLRSY